MVQSTEINKHGQGETKSALEPSPTHMGESSETAPRASIEASATKEAIMPKTLGVTEGDFTSAQPSTQQGAEGEDELWDEIEAKLGPLSNKFGPSSSVNVAGPQNEAPSVDESSIEQSSAFNDHTTPQQPNSASIAGVSLTEESPAGPATSDASDTVTGQGIAQNSTGTQQATAQNCTVIDQAAAQNSAGIITQNADGVQESVAVFKTNIEERKRWVEFARVILFGGLASTMLVFFVGIGFRCASKLDSLTFEQLRHLKELCEDIHWSIPLTYGAIACIYLVIAMYCFMLCPDWHQACVAFAASPGKQSRCEGSIAFHTIVGLGMYSPFVYGIFAVWRKIDEGTASQLHSIALALGNLPSETKALGVTLVFVVLSLPAFAFMFHWKRLFNEKCRE